MNKRSILSVVGVLALVGCSASTNGGSTARGAGTGADGSGAGSSVGSGNSSSGGGSNTNLNVSNDGGPEAGDVLNGVCANQSFDLQRKPAEILLLLDRSASMNDPPDGAPSGTGSKWSLVVPGIDQVIMATSASVSWGLKVFPEGDGSACVAGSVTSMIPVPIAPMNATPVVNGVMATTPQGNGTPTGDAINAAVTYLKTLTDMNPKFILLATDGEPSCNGTTQDTTGARTQAVTSITAAAAAGFKTGMARADPNPLATKFYLASTEDELVTSLETITGQVASCVFDLTSVPPDPTNIAVHVNNTKAPQDTTHMNGWDYTGTDDKQIQIYGSWCDQITAANANTVNFVFGCVGQPPPA